MNKMHGKGLGLNVGIKNVEWKEEAMEGVDIEVKLNNATILSVRSEKKGKYTFQVPITTTDPKNNYTVTFTKDGFAPRVVNINAYLTKDEYTKHTSPKYEFTMDIPLLATTVKDIMPDKSYAKIKWDAVKDHKFTIDPVYAKTASGEEQKILADPDKYYTLLAKKKKKTEDAIAKKNEAAAAALKAKEEEAKRKADEEAKRIADKKAKEDAERAQRERDEALRQEALAKHVADSIAEAKRKNAAEMALAKTEPVKPVKPVEKDNEVIKDRYDAAEAYSINIARRALGLEKERRNREKGRNLTAKYESFNILTSLLDVVDAYDKKNKK